MNKTKTLKTSLLGTVLITLASCTNKENKIVVFNETITPNVVDAGAPSKLTSITKQRARELAADTLQQDSVLDQTMECYRWDQEYYASTSVVSDYDNSHYDINILITLQPSSSNYYFGGMVLYIDEENFVEASVEGRAEGNHITLYYKSDEENTTGELFKEYDKLVMFELSDGEYSANWYKPMHRFVNENTVISIH